MSTTTMMPPPSPMVTHKPKPELYRYKLLAGRHEENHYETGQSVTYTQGEEFWSTDPNLEEKFNSKSLGEAGRKFAKVGQALPTLEYPTGYQAPPVVQPSPKQELKLDQMSIDQLRKLADDLEVDHRQLKTKEALIKALS